MCGVNNSTIQRICFSELNSSELGETKNVCENSPNVTPIFMFIDSAAEKYVTYTNVRLGLQFAN